MLNVVFDRMLAVALGAILITVGAFAVNDPEAVLGYLSRWRRNLGVSISENQVRYVGAAIILVAIIWVVASLVVPLAPIARG